MDLATPAQRAESRGEARAESSGTRLRRRAAGEQVVDEVSKDELLADQTGYSPEARDNAATLVHSFEQYLAEHKNEIDALKFFYSVPHRKRLRYADIKTLVAGDDTSKVLAKGTMNIRTPVTRAT